MSKERKIIYNNLATMLAAGLPILTPDMDFARYVCGTAALYYDPWDIASLFKNIIAVVTNASLREKLIENGKVELADTHKFSQDWDEVATDILTDLNKLVSR